MSAYYTGASVDDAESVRTIRRGIDLGIKLTAPRRPATPIEDTVAAIPGTKRSPGSRRTPPAATLS
jgi:hypothetical protein